MMAFRHQGIVSEDGAQGPHLAPSQCQHDGPWSPCSDTIPWCPKSTLSSSGEWITCDYMESNNQKTKVAHELFPSERLNCDSLHPINRVFEMLFSISSLKSTVWWSLVLAADTYNSRVDFNHTIHDVVQNLKSGIVSTQRWPNLW